MANWCSNKLSITTTTPEQKAELKQWHEYITSDDYFTSPAKLGFFSLLLPTPNGMKDREAVDTQVALWGTKWDINEFQNIDYSTAGDDSLVLEFDTAWSPPLGVCMEIARRGYLIRLEYFEPGMCFGGYVENNNNIAEPEITHSDDINDPKDEVRQEIDDTFAISDWYDYEEEDEDDNDQDQLINNGVI